MTPRIPPEAALKPGRRDPLALLTVWFVRKSFYGVLFLGVIVAAVVGRTNEIGVDFHSLREVVRDLVSPLAGVILAFALRLGSSLAGLALAYPLARRHETTLEARRSFGKSIGTWLDRLHVMRAYRSLRWTHHVRQLAIRRLDTTGSRLSRLDPILDVANIALLIALIVIVPTLESTAG